MNRRQLIERAGITLGALGLPALVEACTPSAPPGPRAAANADAPKSGNVLPTYVPFPNKPAPEYPSQGDPYLDGYDNYPRDPAKMISGEVGAGSSVTAMTIGLFPPPTPYENNPAWQAINKQLNVDFKMNIVAPG
ncbi:MAG TPA: hypothetical protein VF937_02595, partial [Chloroflexota bacterium]